MQLFPSGRVKKPGNWFLTEMVGSLQDNERGVISVAIKHIVSTVIPHNVR